MRLKSTIDALLFSASTIQTVQLWYQPCNENILCILVLIQVFKPLIKWSKLTSCNRILCVLKLPSLLHKFLMREMLQIFSRWIKYTFHTQIVEIVVRIWVFIKISNSLNEKVSNIHPDLNNALGTHVYSTASNLASVFAVNFFLTALKRICEIGVYCVPKR